ncbi:DUF1353 domain-containing protein [Candidatus Pacearchaeota archaeon]|nr:DUF1353 domain-containing protein [Candidatus Pacearchaeota archaeon]
MNEGIQLKKVPNTGNIAKFEVTEDYKCEVSDIVIPKGFITDGASIPRIFWPVFPPFGQYFNAAVEHDYLYSITYQTRKEGDKIFLEQMKNDGVKWFTRKMIYRAVRMFGWVTYNKFKRRHNG